MKENLLGKTIYIAWKEAKELIGQYNNHQDRIMVQVNGKPKVLSGFSFPKSEVQAIINQNDTERFFIALAYHDGTIRDNEAAGFSAVIMGMDANDNLLVTDDHNISDYCRPCPTMCARNYDLSSL